MASTVPPSDPAAASDAAASSPGGGARRASSLVAAGILLSRVAGLARERVFAHYFGTTIFAEAFRAGLRMPNVLQNLLGEGTLSASFIPVYSELLEQGRHRDAGRVAGAVFALLLVVAGALALIGVAFAPALVSLFLPGFTGERRELTVLVTQILFPMTGVLVLSAWSLGILNSHRHFFVPYFAPVLWNAAMIATLLVFGGALPPERLVVALAWGALVGGALQFVVQLPWVLRLERELKIGWGTRIAEVRETIRNAGPAIMGRGVVQLSGWLDMVLASFLAVGAVAAITYAQVLYMLPVSLFGMSVAAAELPELSRARSGETEALRLRTVAALKRVAFFVIPSAVAFLLLGDVLVGALYQTGEFGRTDTLLVYATLAAYSVGLIASTSTRLFSSTFFALRDTRTPARLAALRVTIAAVVGAVLMVQFEPVAPFGAGGPQLSGGLLNHIQIDGRSLGAVGLALGTGVAAWVEWVLLRRALRRKIGSVDPGMGVVVRMVGAALAAGAAAWLLRWLLPPLHPIPLAAAVCTVFGVVYLGLAAWLGLDEVQGVRARFARIIRR